MTNDNTMNWYKQAQLEKKLILMRGVSGSGKSTLAKELGGEHTYSTDEFFMRDGEYKFDSNLIGKAHQWNKDRVEESMNKGVSPIVVDNTNRQFWEMKKYVEMANQYGYEVEFRQPDWHPDLYTPEGKWNFDFLKGRNVHDVPDEMLKRMINTYQYNPTVEDVLKSKDPWEK